MTTAAPTSIFSPNAQYLLCTRGYAHKGPNHPICPHKENHNGEEVRHETQLDAACRVGMDKPEYIDLITHNLFAPNSPAWFNLPCKICGQDKVQGTCSACFKFDVADTMDSILDVTRKAGLVLKAGGGVGYVVSEVRPEGAPVNSTHRHALGPLGVLRIYQTLAKEITQGGQRNAAQMGILHCSHPDILKFIQMKLDDPQAMDTFNISVACTDEFMDQVANGEGPAIGTWKEMTNAAWTNGDPGCYFIDTAEKGNPTPWLGKLTGSNPCSEVPLLDNEVCSLGSINLNKFVINDGKDVNWDHLDEVTRTSIQFLDDILDVNEFPTPEIDAAARLTRKLGLGVMGWADMLALMKIPYGSDQSIDLGKNVMAFIDEKAHNESIHIASDKGIAPCFGMEEAQDKEGNHSFYRNATVTAIAPTGTIAILMGASGGIEPHFKLEWDRKTGEGHVMTERIAVADEIGDFIPLTAHEIPADQQVWMQAAFQDHVDLAVSKTINLPNSATPQQISDAYLLAWKSGCKGVTVFRDGCRGEQVLTDVGGHDKMKNDPYPSLTGRAPQQQLIPTEEPPSARHKMPETAKSIRHRFQIGEQEGYLNVGLYEDGSPGELFINASKQGSTIRGLLDGIGIMTSIALQYGVPVDVIIRKFRHMSFEPQGMTQNKEIPMATSILDYIAHFLEEQFGTQQQANNMRDRNIEAFDSWFQNQNGNGDTCPDCGNGLIYSEGCMKCSSGCGWTKC